MNSITKLFVISFSVSFFSCEPKVPTCEMTMEDLLKGNEESIFPINSGNSNPSFRDKGKDSIEGGYYTFYKNGRLQEYLFYRNEDTVIYKEQYDSLGYLMYLEGTPLIHKSAELTHDSLTLKYYLFSMKNKYNSVRVSINRNDPVSLDLSKDKLFSNVQVGKYLIKGLYKEQDIDCYFEVEYQNECTHEKKFLKDSIYFHFKPGN